MIASSYPGLELLLAGYFHQDWIDEFKSPEDLLEGFAAEQPNNAIDRVIDELPRFIDEMRQQSDAEKVLLDWGCYYEPHYEHRTVEQWLEHVLERLVELRSLRD